MKNWVDWLNNYYFFQLLGVGAFLMAFYNTFLKTKVQDWWASRSKRGIEKRLKELSQFISRIAGFQKTPNDFYIVAIHELSKSIFVLCTAALLFVLFMILYFFGDGELRDSSMLNIVLVVISLVILWIGVVSSGDLMKLARYYRYPELLISEIIDLIKSGRKNGYIAGNEKEILKLIENTNIYPSFDLGPVKELVDNSEQQ